MQLDLLVDGVKRWEHIPRVIYNVLLLCKDCLLGFWDNVGMNHWFANFGEAFTNKRTAEDPIVVFKGFVYFCFDVLWDDALFTFP